MLMFQCLRDGLLESRLGCVKEIDVPVRTAGKRPSSTGWSIDPICQNVVNELRDLRVLG